MPVKTPNLHLPVIQVSLVNKTSTSDSQAHFFSSLWPDILPICKNIIKILALCPSKNFSNLATSCEMKLTPFATVRTLLKNSSRYFETFQRHSYAGALATINVGFLSVNF